MEKWIPIKGFEGLYEVSDFGNVQSVDRRIDFVDGRYATYKGKSIKKVVNSNGYYVLNLWINSKMHTRYIHRLVAEHFITAVEGKYFINHKDGDKLNNSLDNLEWVTLKENTKHSQQSGLTPESHCAKRVEQYDLQGNLIATYESYYEAAKLTGFNSSKIGLVVRGKRKTHKGFIWKGV